MNKELKQALRVIKVECEKHSECNVECQLYTICGLCSPEELEVDDE